jgi:hypothetical protein
MILILGGESLNAPAADGERRPLVASRYGRRLPQNCKAVAHGLDGNRKIRGMVEHIATIAR